MDSRYTEVYILKNERFYGKNFAAPGGEAAAKELLLKLGLQAGDKVLDIGCGQGGLAMCMARYYGAHVHGLEVSKNMINLGSKRLAAEESCVKQRVQLELADAIAVQLKKNYYDVIFSKDVIVHIKDKAKLFENCKAAVRPGGRLFIADWCRGDKQPSQSFIDYYHSSVFFNIETISSNVAHMEAAGFKGVKAEDLTLEMNNNIEHSLKHFRPTKQAFIQDFDAESYDATIDRLSQYATWTKNGEMLWVLFTADG